MPRKSLPKKTAEKPKRVHTQRHLKLPTHAYEALKAAMNGGSSHAREIVDRLLPGESEVTIMSALSFNKERMRKDIKIEVKSGLFIYSNSDSMAPVRCCIVRRVA